MNISVVGTGYVGLVTGVCLSEIGHNVTCIDVDIEKLQALRDGKSPIHEPGLEELMRINLAEGRLRFTTEFSDGMADCEIVFIAVGTPSHPDGSADLRSIEQASADIARHVENDVLVVVKSTVPVGTCNIVQRLLQSHVKEGLEVETASNPEFLREGSAIHDMFHGDRIVIGTESAEAAEKLIDLYRPLRTPIFRTDIRSAEMIKYASNAFLATKISFINEISNVCEKIGADVEAVAAGMGMDSRIGSRFLRAGIGYGGSCFPKDTKALVQIAGNVSCEFKLLRAVIEVNALQRTLLVEKAMQRLGQLEGKRIALLGLSFKPNTDDMREAPSINISQQLTRLGSIVVAYDPVSMGNARKALPASIQYAGSLEEALTDADLTMILTEWDEIRKLDLMKVKEWMKQPLLFDGRNCFSLDQAKEARIEYHSFGRQPVFPE